MDNEPIKVTIDVYDLNENKEVTTKTTKQTINLSIEKDKKFGLKIIEKGREHLLKYLEENRLNLVDKEIPDILVRLGEIYKNSNEKTKQDKMSEFVEAYKSSAVKQGRQNDIIKAEVLSMWAAFIGPNEKLVKNMVDNFLLKEEVEQNKQITEQIGRAGRPRQQEGTNTQLANINIATTTINRNISTNQQQNPRV